MLIRISIVIMLAMLPALRGSTDEYRQPRPIQGAENSLDLVYLPDRLCGDWQDRWLRMNVHWPRDLRPGQRLPCILFVHGGGYGGGDKDTGFCKQAKERAVAQGFVVANMNYILGRNIFPQVYYDFDAAVRFLRASADKYHVDPDRIGAWGFSAGGWLSSSGGFTDAGDLYVRSKTAISEAWPMDDPRRVSLRARIQRPRRGELIPLLLPMDSPRPLHAEYSSRIQALQADFNHFEANIAPNAPAICTYVGEGGVNKMQQPARRAGVDFQALTLSHPRKKFEGAASVHVPPLEMLVPSPHGEEMIELQDRVLAWFRRILVEEPRTPAPEFRPNRRVFETRVRVRSITTSADIDVHYTTDGSNPTTASPVWKGPVEIAETTVIKAIAAKRGMRTSGTTCVRFLKTKLPPQITGPAEPVLMARVGEPLEVQFSAGAEPPVTWRLAAHLRPEEGHRFKGGLREFGGLQFDHARGLLHGTPTRSFVYTLLVQAAWQPGQRADVRTYVLRVRDADGTASEDVSSASRASASAPAEN